MPHGCTISGALTWLGCYLLEVTGATLHFAGIEIHTRSLGWGSNGVYAGLYSMDSTRKGSNRTSKQLVTLMNVSSLFTIGPVGKHQTRREDR